MEFAYAAYRVFGIGILVSFIHNVPHFLPAPLKTILNHRFCNKQAYFIYQMLDEWNFLMWNK